jgi:hypothetical protein
MMDAAMDYEIANPHPARTSRSDRWVTASRRPSPIWSTTASPRTRDRSCDLHLGRPNSTATTTRWPAWPSRLPAALWSLRLNCCAWPAEQDRIRGELETAGYTITDILPANGQHLAVLSHDGEDLTPGSHAACPGRGVFFRFYVPLEPVHYRANPDRYRHTFRFRPAAPSVTPAPDRPCPEPAEPDPSRCLVIQRNREWQAAATVRHRWLATHLFARRTAPREVAQFVARQLLTMPDPLRSGLAQAHSAEAFKGHQP